MTHSRQKICHLIYDLASTKYYELNDYQYFMQPHFIFRSEDTFTFVISTGMWPADVHKV